MSSVALSQSISNAYLNRRPIRNTSVLSRLSRSNTGTVYCDPKEAEVESQVERAIVEAENPISFDESEEIFINNQRATWLNKDEILNWKGPIPLDQYRLNVDNNPTLITKKPKEKLKYKQEVHVKYLKPPTPKPSELVIVQEPNRQLPPAPPLIIRQPAPRQVTPEPIVIREAPPHIPEPVRRIVHVPGKILPPPARKVIVEKFACEPPKPQQVIIERWLKPEIPPPRVILCKPIERQPIIYDVIETRCDIPTPCPPECEPCPPQHHHHQQQQQQHHQQQLQQHHQQQQQQQQQHHIQENCQSEKHDIIISIFIE